MEGQWTPIKWWPCNLYLMWCIIEKILRYSMSLENITDNYNSKIPFMSSSLAFTSFLFISDKYFLNWPISIVGCDRKIYPITCWAGFWFWFAQSVNMCRRLSRSTPKLSPRVCHWSVGRWSSLRNTLFRKTGGCVSKKCPISMLSTNGKNFKKIQDS